MSDTEPVKDNRAANLACRRKEGFPAPIAAIAAAPAAMAVISFDRNELREIFNLYGRKVAGGEWRDYGIDFTPQKAVFSVYRRACEYALYRIEKDSEAGAKARRLFGGHGDRPRFETRPQSSLGDCRAGHAAEPGFGGNRRRCLICLKPLRLRWSISPALYDGRRPRGIHFAKNRASETTAPRMTTV